MSTCAWLHRKGIARLLNSGSSSEGQGSAYIEARGPRRFARHLAMYALRHNPVACPPDWQTVRIARTRQPGRLRWRFLFAYRRLSR
jgi:hypothetical protein